MSLRLGIHIKVRASARPSVILSRYMVNIMRQVWGDLTHTLQELKNSTFVFFRGLAR